MTKTYFCPLILLVLHHLYLWEYMNRSQKHECRNWDCSRAVPFLGIFVSNFRYSVFEVCSTVCGGASQLNSHKHKVAAPSFTGELVGGQDFGIVSMFYSFFKLRHNDEI